MNRRLRALGTWYTRNGLLGSVGFFRLTEGSVTDTLNLDSNLLQFGYTPAGNIPDGAYNDDLNLDSNIVSFSYTL
jgi:hypothetical protein